MDQNKQLLHDSDEDFDRDHYRYDDVSIKDLFEEDKKAFLPLPDNDFDYARYESASTDKWGKFTLEDGMFTGSAPICTNLRPHMLYAQLIRRTFAIRYMKRP